ncbi:MAG: FAD-dependent monooxygenase [Burkholderiales bacterium]|nr:FAD-dependent monooxygenase [Burkholderiales bacterium]
MDRNEEGALETEAAVVGGGLVALATAHALARAGLQVARIAPAPAPRPPGEALDARVYALSPGNVAFLRSLGAWRRVRTERVAPVHAMRIYGDDARTCLAFDAWEAGVEALAWIAEEAEVAAALRADLAPPVAGACLEVQFGAEAAQLRLDRGASLRARLVVGADGARSRVREAAGIAFCEQPYGQAALVANFECARPHRNVAYQWFRGDSVLALLPLPGDRVSMVWSLPESEAARLAALAPQPLCGEVRRASGAALGALVALAPPQCYPLRRARAARTVGPRVALAGDAAHVIHPLAGQGANLGLQDARALGEVLGAREPLRDPGDVRLLRRYERARAEDVLAMDALVHGLARLFAAQGAPIAALRNAGLALLDRLSVVKNLLARRAMA